MTRRDLIVVGGGLAGAALATVMARAGRDVLLLERETRFRDRVRGEVIMPWGTAEARELGIYDELRAACGLPTPRWTTWVAGQMGPSQDFGEAGFLAFSHPAMQEAMLAIAAAAGAEVRRGVTLRSVAPGQPASIAFADSDGTAHQLQARLVIGADGRGGVVAKAMGVEAKRDPRAIMIVGLELAGGFDTLRSVNYFLDPDSAYSAIVVRTRPDRSRAYLMHHTDLQPRTLAGEGDRAEVLRLLERAGLPEAWLAGAAPDSPLASFDGAWRWVDRPAAPGVVLVGDAASASDPAWGNGLSRTLRDVRLLRDALLAEADWDCATARYAEAHRDFCGRLKAWEDVHRELFATPGAEAAQRRWQVLGLLRQDPGRAPNLLGLGPDVPFDEAARQRFLGAA